MAVAADDHTDSSCSRPANDIPLHDSSGSEDETHEEKDEGGRDWAGLPGLIQDNILAKLSPVDYVGYSRVCRGWHQASIEPANLRFIPNYKIPLLLFPVAQGTHVYDITKGEVEIELELGAVGKFYTNRCIGSSFGWLIKTEVESGMIVIFDPFSEYYFQIFDFSFDEVMERRKWLFDVEMRRLNGLVANHEQDDDYIAYNHEYYYKKAVLSANPLHGRGCIVMLIFGHNSRLAYYSLAEQEPFVSPNGVYHRSATDFTWVGWKYVAVNHTYLQDIADVIYSNSRAVFYAVDQTGIVYAIKPQACGSVVVEQIKSPKIFEYFYYFYQPRYIVESFSGEIWVILGSSYPVEFRVYKITDGANWIQLRSLDGQALFLGDNASLSVLAVNHVGCRPNSIYFTISHDPDRLHTIRSDLDDLNTAMDAQDMGVFSLGDNTVEQFNAHGSFTYQEPRATDMYHRPPIWVEAPPRRRRGQVEPQPKKKASKKNA